MSSRSITWFAIIFGVSFALIGIGYCGYGKLQWMTSLESASEHIADEFDEVDHISTDTLAALLGADRSKVPTERAYCDPQDAAAGHGCAHVWDIASAVEG